MRDRERVSTDVLYYHSMNTESVYVGMIKCIGGVTLCTS